MIRLTHHARGVVLPVRAQPGARANAIRGIHDGALKVSVTQVAEKGKANTALVQFLAKRLGLRRSQITLHVGATSTDKQFLIRDLARDELSKRIDAAIGSS